MTWLTFVRGDCGYGSGITMLEHEQSGLPNAMLSPYSHLLKIAV